MALPQGDLTITPFNPQFPYPMDKREQIDTLNDRDVISPYVRWQGMQVHVLETNITYMLVGGLTNEYWVPLGSGEGGGGTGGSNFVGQFATVDLLPSTGIAGNYAYVGSGDTFSLYNWDNTGGTWIEVFPLSPDIVNALNFSNQPSQENPFATILDIPNAETGDRILNPGVLEITSPTTATLTGASWIFGGVNLSYTGALTLTGSPTDPDNRFDIVTFSDEATPAVQTGAPDPEPAIPTPTTAGDLIAQTILRRYSGEDVVVPTTTDYSTAPHLGMWLNDDGVTPIYAPIWRQTLLANTYYDFQISFLAFASDYTTNTQRPMNGILMVNFVSQTGTPAIDPNRVNVRTEDISVRNGDFILMMDPDNANTAIIYARKAAFIGNISFKYQVKKATVFNESLVNGGAYIQIPSGSKYLSWNGRSYIASTGSISFDKPRSYGFNGTPLIGNITISTDYADDTWMAKVLHNSVSEPTVSAPVGVTLAKEGGNYVTGSNNQYLFICHKNDAGSVTRVSYRISQNQL